MNQNELSRNKLGPDGEFFIENNILDITGINPDEDGNLYGYWMLHITAVDEYSLPIIRHNKFYNYKSRNLGFILQKILLKAYILKILKLIFIF